MTSPDIRFIDLATQRERIGAAINRAISDVLEHGSYIMGPEVRLLEEKLADYCGVKNAITCSSGTDALLLPLLAWEVGRGDAVIVPTFTFAATAEVVALTGATPVFADVDPLTFNIDLSSLEMAHRAAEESGLHPVGVIAVDLFGQTPDYDRLREFTSSRSLWLLADGAQSFGATSGGLRTGQFADVTATSFFPAKPLGCYGDGGAIFSDNDQLADTIRSLRVHGQGKSKYDNVRIGANARLDTIQAAILLEKLAIFDSELGERQAIADRYATGLKGAAEIPVVVEGRTSAWAQYTIKIGNRDDVISTLRGFGVPTNVYYPLPLHLQTAYRSFPKASEHLAVSEELSKVVLSLPMHPYLSETDQDHVIKAIWEATHAS